MDSQDLKNHQWKNRIVLVLSNDAANEHYKAQIADLKSVKEECAERKLVMYQVLPSEVRLQKFDGSKSEKWNESSDLFKEFMQKDDEFKMVLIGLDGSVKEERNEPMSSKELFDIIDSMPMREREMRKDN
ncbi:DUF4174 domain-containing protein [Nonlabens sp. Hel1_33_55]|uniref:DUF4174 domain-containing protein n=1 Tax=Nonlabens sp. Hel1_33_55 TaxID=1336802 RepID=UPI0012FDED93|nr:DUF4174 domain-containing protein [Nonlabens sp. Hel1_33_55]